MFPECFLTFALCVLGRSLHVWDFACLTCGLFLAELASEVSEPIIQLICPIRVAVVVFSTSNVLLDVNVSQ